jgi:hypothetical protein
MSIFMRADDESCGIKIKRYYNIDFEISVKGGQHVSNRGR